MQIRARHLHVLVALLLASLSLSAAAQDGDPRPAAKDETPVADQPAPKQAVTHHRVNIGGKAIPYTATAATIDLRNDAGDLTGRMFYIAYTQDSVADLIRRPVTFVFNGGPGSSSMWLHMGSFGPVRVEVDDGQPTPPPPYTVHENPDSLLDRTDLIFVDAMGTGFSRLAKKGQAKSFYSTDGDIAAFGQFIQRWVSANGRWNSPKFLLGESYGTTRAAGLLRWLQRNGMAFNGAVMVSCYFNAWDDFNGPAFSSDLPYELYLPTMAASAWYHDRLRPKPADLKALLDEVRGFALGEYAHALAQGSHLGEAERHEVLVKLQRYTSMPESLLRNADLRLMPERFQKELLRDERRTVGRLDARFQGIDHDAAGETPESDPASDTLTAAFTAAFNSYVHGELGFTSDEIYKPTNYGEVGREWDAHHEVDGHAPMPDVAEDLRIAMSANPHLQIFAANGYYDFATPFFETEYTIAHMGLEPVLEKNFHWGYYPSGHMIYIHPPARRQLKEDLAKFYEAAAPAR